jgi:hypothetical protein
VGFPLALLRTTVFKVLPIEKPYLVLLLQVLPSTLHPVPVTNIPAPFVLVPPL